ncbi:MAG: DUF4175 family protein [Bacteroidia bacterium]
MKQRNNDIYQKLDAFIRKYYNNQLIKGSILFAGIFLLGFILVSVFEYYGRYTSSTRAILFFALLISSLISLVYYIIIPLARLYRIRKSLNYTEAAKIIGAHFSEVQDKLLNTLQLLESAPESGSLLEAAIQQKTEELKPVPFSSAIQFSKNIRYLKFTLIPVLILLSILIWSPDMLGDGAERVLYFNKEFKMKAPFEIEILNQELAAEQYGNFKLNVKTNGGKIPSEMYLLFDNQRYKMLSKEPGHFEYEWNNLQKSLSFKFESSGFEFGPFDLIVSGKPILLNYQAKLNYPTYLGLKNEVLNNPGDLNIPAGTYIEWMFIGKNTDDIQLKFNKVDHHAFSEDGIHFQFKKKFFLSDAYTIQSYSKEKRKGDSLHFVIQVIPDEFPQIEVSEQQDSSSRKLIYFSGNVEDDHGLKKLEFHYRFLKSENAEKVKRGLQTFPIVLRSDKISSFNHVFNLFEAGLESADEIEYYFEVWDNDGVHGSKFSRSKIFSLKAPDKKELREEANEGSKALENKMEESLREAKDLQKDLKDLQRKMQSEKQLNWEDQRKMEKLMERQKELAKKINDLKEEFKSNKRKEQEFKEENQKILEKQQQLQKMMDEIMPEEMKKMMKQLDDLMKLQNKDRMQQEMEKLQLNNKDVEKELDRMLEMYKEMEVEKKMEESIERLNDLSKKQEDLSNKSKEKSDTKENLKKAQDELNKEFKDLKEEMKEMQEKNKSLEEPKDLKNLDKQQESIENKMQKASEELEKGNEKKAAEQEKEAADEMEEMAEQMKDQMEKEEEEKVEMNIQALREILENLLQLSKDQESLMERMKAITGYNPQFVQIAQEQKSLKDNAKLVEDSLFALSKDAPEIRAYVNREVNKMNDHMDRAVKGFSNRNQQEIKSQQQYAMTRMNNLALMLSDVLKQLQQQKQQQQKGKSGKGKPSPKEGSGKPSMSKLKKMQDELNKQLKEGQNKNGTGEKGKMSSEQFARMAAQQMAIRQQLQKMASEMDALQKEQMGGGKQLGDLQKLMEQTEKELFNKRLSQETIMRQQEILTRLLEHEKAEKKQEQDTKREAEQSKQGPKPSPKYFEQMNKKQNRETELLKTVPPGMQPYYKDKAKEYLNSLPQ